MASALHQAGRSEESIRRNPDAFLRGPSPSFGTGGTAWATDSFNFDGTSMATLIRYFLYERSESQISRGFLWVFEGQGMIDGHHLCSHPRGGRVPHLANPRGHRRILF